jgi:hypothetical protein
MVGVVDGAILGAKEGDSEGAGSASNVYLE